MKTTIKKLFSILLVLLLVVSTMEINANAATYKIDKTSLKLYTGETYQLKINGGIKKATWWSSNKDVASVTNTGKIKALKKGTVRIKVNFKENGKIVGRLQCNLVVENDLRKVSDKISTEYYRAESNDKILGFKVIYALVTNTSEYDLGATPRLVFYDEDDNKVSIQEQTIRVYDYPYTSYITHGTLPSGKQALFAFDEPDKPYKYYKIEYTDIKDQQSKQKNLDSQVEINLIDTQGKLNLEINNKTGNLAKVQAFVSFYKNNELIKVISFEEKIDINTITILLAEKQRMPNFDYDTYKISYTATAQ